LQPRIPRITLTNRRPDVGDDLPPEQDIPLVRISACCLPAPRLNFRETPANPRLRRPARTIALCEAAGSGRGPRPRMRGVASKMLLFAHQAPRGEGDLARKSVRMHTNSSVPRTPLFAAARRQVA
jgi:hypothetical protein